MENRRIFSKKDRKPSSKHKTECDHELPSRFQCRTSFEVMIKSSEVQREIKVISNHHSSLMSSNRVNQEQNGHGNEADSENNETFSTQRSNHRDSESASILSMSSESLNKKLKISGRSSNIREPESIEKEGTSKKTDCIELKNSGLSSNIREPESIEKERTSKKSCSQLPEYSQNSHLCYAKDKAAMGKRKLCSNKFMNSKLNFYNKRNLNLSSSKADSPWKYPNDFSPLRMHNYLLKDTQQENDLAGGDYVKSGIEEKIRIAIPENSQFSNVSEIFSFFQKDINKQKAEPLTEESVHSDMSFDNDNFVNKCFNKHNEIFEDSDNYHFLESKHQMFIDKESESRNSKPFICQENNVKYSWSSNLSVTGDTHKDSNDFSGLSYKQTSNKREDTSPKEGFEFQKVPIKSCRTPNKNTNRKSNFRSETISDPEDFISQNKKRMDNSQSSHRSSASLDLNHGFKTEKKELPDDPLYDAHKTLSSNHDFDLFNESKNFSHQDSNNKISSVSSNLSRNGESYQNSLNKFHCPMNNKSRKLRDSFAGLSLGPVSDSHKDVKDIYVLSKPKVKSRQEPNISDGGGSLSFDTKIQEFTMQSAESSSLDIDVGRVSATTSSTYHSADDSDKWNISVSELVEYFENLNSATVDQDLKTRAELPVQVNSACNGNKGINENSLDSNKNRRKLHMEEECLNNGKDGNNTACKLMDLTKITLSPTCNTFNVSDSDCHSKSSDSLFYKEARKMGKCGSVDDIDKNEDDGDFRKNALHLINKLKEPESEHIQKVDLLHIPKSESNISLQQNQSLELETEYPKELTEKTYNNTQMDQLSGSVQKSSENLGTNSYQRSFISRWRLMSLVIVLIVLLIRIYWIKIDGRFCKNF